ncbi:MAG: tetratricopeptide repeat protein [Chloroflexi bacterium]|nr:tetratricopeptide repeat protein [Chloroflexota bacterium]
MVQEIIADRVRLIDEIGRGGMGMVYRGIYLPTGQAVAVKALRPEAVQRDPIMLERFRREAEALARLNHPNIARVMDTLEHDDRHFIVMEYYGRGDLHTLMKAESPLSIPRIQQIAIELADALTRAHYLNIIHRDIKPGNVLIADDGSAKLTDFGVAHFGAKDSVTGVGIVVGTLYYLSPEAIDGEVVDARADIWSFGVMLYEMIAGRRPFDTDNAATTALAILTQPTPDLEAFRPNCPIALVDLVNRMLEKQKDARIGSVRLVGAELESVIQGHTDTQIVSRAHTEVTSRFVTPTPHAGSVKNNLPTQTTAFVGREQELEALIRLFSEPEVRLVTIIAPGGMGKTRLALETAARFTHPPARSTTGLGLRFNDGVTLIELAPLTDPSAIVPAIAAAVGCDFQSDGRSPADQLLDFLSEKRILLVLDNFEHLLEGALVVSDILRRAPHVRIIATSRARLNLNEESLFRIEGLTFPSWDTPEDALEYAAVKLFMQGARRAQPGFTLTAEDLPRVAQICRLVEGMPLGLLLAAAWLDSLSLEEIAQEIHNGLDFLSTEARNVPERQRSMRAVFDYSWHLLGEDERDILKMISVFRGGWTREAAQDVTGANLRQLTTLVNKSLVRRNANSGRYSVHELLRQYLARHLAADPALERTAQERHSVYFRRWLIDNQSRFAGAHVRAALAQIDADIENVTIAWTWMVEHGDAADIQRFQYALVGVHELTGHYTEGARVFADGLERLLKRTSEGELDPLVPLRMRLYWTILAGQVGDRFISMDEIVEGMPLLRDRGTPADNNLALNMLAYAAMLAGNYEDAKARAQEAAALLDGIDDPLLAAITLGNLGYIHFLTGDYPEAERIVRQDLRRADASGNEIQMARVRNMLGEICHAMGQDEQAKKLFEESYDLSMALGNRAYVAYVATNLGNVLHRLGRYPESIARYEESVTLHREAGNRRGVAEASNMLAGAWLMLGEYQRAIPYHEQALDVFRQIGDVRGIANSLAMLSSAESSSGVFASALEHAEECLRLRRQLGNPMEIADALGHLSRAHIFAGALDEAVPVIDAIRQLSEANDAMRIPLTAAYAASAVPLYLMRGDYRGLLDITGPFVAQLENAGMSFALSVMYYSVARAHHGLGDRANAAEFYRRSLRAGVDSGAEMWMAANLAELALIAYGDASPVLAVERISMAYAHGKLPHWIRLHVEDLLEKLRTRLPAEEFAAASARGEALNLLTTARDVLQEPATN